MSFVLSLASLTLQPVLPLQCVFKSLGCPSGREPLLPGSPLMSHQASCKEKRQCAGPASQRQKEAFAEIAAAAPGYAERARVAAAPRAARHLALHPRRPPAAREATVWIPKTDLQHNE